MRGLKLVILSLLVRLKRRTPPGVRGLKPADYPLLTNRTLSHPTRGAWIETSLEMQNNKYALSHPTRGAWIETIMVRTYYAFTLSHPTRGAWIETYLGYFGSAIFGRTPPGVRGLKHNTLIFN